MVTARGRFDYFCRSLRCYLDQTYPNKELVIVNEGPKDYQDQIIAHLQNLENDIKTVWLNGNYTLGALRNISVGLSTGDLFCQWDDDDFCTPQRLSTQYSYLEKHKGKVCYLSDQLHYYFDEKMLYWDDWKNHASNGIKRCSLIPGTLMAHRHVWHDWFVRYPSSGKNARQGEDSVVADIFLSREPEKVLLLEDFGYMHVYTQHGVNQVFSKEHHWEISDMRSQYRDKIIKFKGQICSSLDYFNLGQNIKVMCRDGLVFTYENAKNKLCDSDQGSLRTPEKSYFLL